MKPEEAIARLEESRAALEREVAGLSLEDLCGPKVEGTWSILDLLAHIATWEQSLLQPMRRMNDGEPFQPENIPDHLAWNDQQEVIWRQLPVETIQAQFATTRQELLAEAGRVTAENWEETLPAPWGGEDTLARMLAGLAWHETGHTKSIIHWKVGK